MNQVRMRDTQRLGANAADIPKPSTDLIAQADTILRLCEKLDATRAQIRTAEQSYRLAQKTLAEAEQKRDQRGTLADTLEEIATAKAALAAVEQTIIQHRRRLPTIELELSKLDGEFAVAVTNILRPLRARAAQKFRDAARRAKEARDEFVGLGDASGGQDQHAVSISIGDLEDGRDLMYERERATPEFVREWWPIRLAMKAAERSYLGR